MGWRHIRRVLGVPLLLLALIFTFWPAATHYAYADNGFTVNPTSGSPGTTISLIPTNTQTFTAGAQVTIFFLDECADQPLTNIYAVQPNGQLPTNMTVQVPPDSTCGGTTAGVDLIVGATNPIILGQVPFQITGGPVSTPTNTTTGTPPTLTPSVTGTPPTATATTYQNPQFVLNPTTAALGQSVSFTAGSFLPNEVVTLTTLINNAVITLAPGSVTADSNGFATGSFSIPPTASGVILPNGSGGNGGYSASIRLTGASSARTQTATLNVPPTQINAGTSALTPGGTFTVTGGGFFTNETVALTLVNASGVISNLGTTLAHSDGTMATNVTAPTINGPYTLKVVGQTSTLVASQSVTVGQGLGITVSPVITTPNSMVTVKGFGFTPSSTIVINGLDGGPATTPSDANGAFTISLPIPGSLPASSVITINASDPNSLAASTYLTIDNGQQAAIIANPAQVNPGQSILINGTNFAAGENVNLTLSSNDSPTIPITTTSVTVPVDATRSFVTTYIMPSLTNGVYLMVATGQSSTRTAVTSLTLQNGLPGATATPTSSTGYVPFPTPANTPISLPTATTTPLPPGSGLITYFAEGFTGQAATNKIATFAEALNLFNTTSAPASVTVTYYVLTGTTGGTTAAGRATLSGARLPAAVTQRAQTLSLAPLAALSLSVNSAVGNDKQVSIAVQHSPGVVAQMTIARTSTSGGVLDAAATTGSAQASTTWDLAEGYAGAEFQEYLSFFNPNPLPASVQVRFLPTSGSPPNPLTYQMVANGRLSVNVRQAYLKLVGAHGPKSIAIIVTSNQKIVVDRVLYWGSGSGSGKYGYEIAPGISSGSTTLAFPALLLTGADEPYITVLNPGAGPASLQFTFRDSAGHTLASYTNSVRSLARLTVPIRNILRNVSGVVSATMTASAPVVAEAPIYFGGSPNQGTHAGVDELGYTGALSAATGGFDAGTATLYVFNPTNAPIQITQRVGMAQGGAGTAGFSIPPFSSHVTTLPAGAAGPRGLLLTSTGTFVAAVINGGDGRPSAWGGTLLAP